MERTKFSKGIELEKNDQIDGLIMIPRLVFYDLLTCEEPSNAIALYLLYYYMAKFQDTEAPIAYTAYISAHLNWNPDKVRRIKKILISLNLIKDAVSYDENGKIDEHHIIVNLQPKPISLSDPHAEITQTPLYNMIFKREKIIPPPLEWVVEYCKVVRKNKVDPETFFEFYQSKGWMIGKNRMKNWHAAIHTWEKSSQTDKTPQAYRKPYIIDDGIKYNLSPDGQYRNTGGEIFIE